MPNFVVSAGGARPPRGVSAVWGHADAGAIDDLRVEADALLPGQGLRAEFGGQCDGLLGCAVVDRHPAAAIGQAGHDRPADPAGAQYGHRHAGQVGGLAAHSLAEGVQGPAVVGVEGVEPISWVRTVWPV